MRYGTFVEVACAKRRVSRQRRRSVAGARATHPCRAADRRGHCVAAHGRRRCCGSGGRSCVADGTATDGTAADGTVCCAVRIRGRRPRGSDGRLQSLKLSAHLFSPGRGERGAVFEEAMRRAGGGGRQRRGNAGPGRKVEKVLMAQVCKRLHSRPRILGMAT